MPPGGTDEPGRSRSGSWRAWRPPRPGSTTTGSGPRRSRARSDPRAVYGTADRAFRELVARFGEDRVRDLVTRLGEGHAFGAAFRDALGVAPAEFETDLVVRLSAVAALHQSY
jgi:hypothetical protein